MMALTFIVGSFPLATPAAIPTLAEALEAAVMPILLNRTHEYFNSSWSFACVQASPSCSVTRCACCISHSRRYYLLRALCHSNAHAACVLHHSNGCSFRGQANTCFFRYKDASTTLELCAGESNVAGQPCSTFDSYAWGSTTKSTTATLVLQLIGAGKLGLNDSVVTHADAYLKKITKGAASLVSLCVPTSARPLTARSPSLHIRRSGPQLHVVSVTIAVAFNRPTLCYFVCFFASACMCALVKRVHM
jgi:hypothetical protein